MKRAARRSSVVAGLVVGILALTGSAVATASGPTAHAAATGYVYTYATHYRNAPGRSVRAIFAGHTYGGALDLEVLIDRRPCARLFRLERPRSTVSAFAGYTVRGRFRIHASINRSAQGINYICAYLTPHSSSVRTLYRYFSAYDVASTPSFTA